MALTPDRGQGWVGKEKVGTGIGRIGETCIFIYIYIHILLEREFVLFLRRKTTTKQQFELFCSFFVNTPFVLKSLVGASFFAGCAVGSTARWGLFDHRP